MPLRESLELRDLLSTLVLYIFICASPRRIDRCKHYFWAPSRPPYFRRKLDSLPSGYQFFSFFRPGLHWILSQRGTQSFVTLAPRTKYILNSGRGVELEIFEKKTFFQFLKNCRFVFSILYSLSFSVLRLRNFTQMLSMLTSTQSRSKEIF